MSYHDLSTQKDMTTGNVSYESDEVLAWRATQEVGAFQELYQRYKLPIYRYHLARTGNERDARDLTSQTFHLAFEGITSYRFGGRLLKWLFGIANQIQGNHFRMGGDRFPLFEREAALQEEIGEIANAIDALNDDMAEALVLRFFAGLNASEIGQVMTKSDTAIKMLVYTGLRNLEAQLASM